MPFVLDSSAVLAMLLPDEQSAAVDRLADSLVHSPAIVPPIWPLEVRNALLVALRAGRITSREFEDRVDLVEALPVEVDGGARTEVLADSVGIARRHGLSVYDASYLELARRVALPLATLDRRLRKAGASLKIRILP
jgi:predicted nucleic acid-binding protein